MNKKQTIDILIVVMGVAIALTSYFYLEGSHRWLFLLLGAGLALLFFILALRDRRPETAHYLSLPTASQPPKAEVTEVVLLNDENQPLATWTLYGKISMVIGRDVGENQVNINLNNSTYSNGYPDFKTAGLVRQEALIGPFVDRTKDFAKAKKMGYEKSADGTWHHNEDGITLQEVETILHDRFRHRGGISKLNSVYTRLG